MKRVPRRVWLFAAALILVAQTPYLAGYLNTPPGGAFTGNAFEQTRVDYNSHLAKMQIGLRGGWRYRILFTPEEHPGIFIQPFYIALGHVARLTGLAPVSVYHLARTVFTLAMMIAIWAFVARFLPEDGTRWAALLLATVVGGLGWALYLVAPAQAADLAPIEFWLLDAYTFLAALTFPHFAASIALLLGFFLVLDRWLVAPDWRRIAWLTLGSLLLGWLQPFDLLLTGLVVGVLVLLALAGRRLSLAQALMLAPVAAAHLLAVGYHYVALESDPVWRAFAAQNLTLSPPPVYYLLGYCWLLVPAVVGGVRLRRGAGAGLRLPVVWVLVTALLLYAPLPTQRRFLLGVQVPLAALAAAGLEQGRQWWLRRGGTAGRWRWLFTAVLSFSALTHALFVLSAITSVTPTARPRLFLGADELAALAWLREQPPETVILAAFPSGGQAVAFSGRRAYLGHWIETPDFEARSQQVSAFFDPAAMSDAERLALLEGAGIDCVWHDDAARALGPWSPGEADFLRAAFASDSVTVYEVRP